MFVYTLNALLWNIVHRYMLKILNVDTIKKPSLRSEGLSGAYGTLTYTIKKSHKTAIY